jgi:hypothetical protein
MQHKPEITISNTDKLIDPDIEKFNFPKRPRPYYNDGDPYIDNFRF